ncbi:MAG: P-loop NTPase [Lachnospiraceae bacterium]
MDQAEQLRNVMKKSQVTEQENARVITITSGKGGVGKSNIAVNMAAQFRKMGKRVIIFDADIGLANVEVLLGTSPKLHLGDLIFYKRKMSEIITEGPMNIGFISGGSGVSGISNLSREQISYLVTSLSELNSLTDIIIIDTGAGMSDSVMEFLISSPEIIVVVTPDPTSMTDSYSLLKSLYKHPEFDRDGTKIEIITNRVSSEEEANLTYKKLNAVVAKFLQGRIEYMGMIPFDEELMNAVKNQKIVSMERISAKSSRAFESLASKLVYNDTGKVQKRRGISQIFSNLISRKLV